LFDSLGVRRRYLLGCCFHNVLNPNRAGETVKSSGDQDAFTEETGGFLLVIYVVPGIVFIILQHEAHLVLGDDFPAKRLPLGLSLRDGLVRAIGLQCPRRRRGTAKLHQCDRQDGSGSFHL
jgi:hypothetical protein